MFVLNAEGNITCDDFRVSVSLSDISSIYSCGTVIADRIKRTEVLCVTRSELSFKSVIFKISGLQIKDSDILRIDRCSVLLTELELCRGRSGPLRGYGRRSTST